MDKKAMYKLSYGLFVLTAKEDSKTMAVLSTPQSRRHLSQIS